MSENPFIDPARQRFLELMDEVEERNAPAGELVLARHRVAEPWGVDPWVSCMVEVDRELARLRDLALGQDVDNPESAFVNVAVGAINARILYEEEAALESGVELDDGQMATFLEKLAKDLGERIERLRTEPKDVNMGTSFDDKTLDVTVYPGGERFTIPPVDPEEEHVGHVHWVPKNWTPVDNPTPPEDTDDANDYPEDTGPDTQPFDVLASQDDDLDPEPVPEQELPKDLPPEPSNGKSHPEGLPPEPVDLDAAERELAKSLVDLRKTAGGSGHPTIGGAHQSPADTDPDMGATGRRAKNEE